MRTIETNVHDDGSRPGGGQRAEEAGLLREDVRGVRQARASCRSARTGTCCSARPPPAAGRTPAREAIDEYLALAYCKERGLPVVIGRLFNTVGPRQTGSLRHGHSQLRAPGARRRADHRPRRWEQRRCFCHVSDVVSAIADLMEIDAAVGEVFNVGSTEEVTISELAERGADRLRFGLGDPVPAVRGGLRGWLRGHAPTDPGHLQDRRSDWLAPDADPR